jgi:hemerythrin
MLTWSEEFATGSKLVDLQHQRLIENINALEALLSGPPPARAACDQLVSFLEKYVNTHFKFEEICMESYRCPAHAQNKREHAAFLDVFTQFKQRYLAEGSRPEVLRSLHHAATKWIAHHILTVDIQLKGCMGIHLARPAHRPEPAAVGDANALRQPAAVS